MKTKIKQEIIRTGADDRLRKATSLLAEYVRNKGGFAINVVQTVGKDTVVMVSTSDRMMAEVFLQVASAIGGINLKQVLDDVVSEAVPGETIIPAPILKEPVN